MLMEIYNLLRSHFPGAVPFDAGGVEMYLHSHSDGESILADIGAQPHSSFQTLASRATQVDHLLAFQPKALRDFAVLQGQPVPKLGQRLHIHSERCGDLGKGGEAQVRDQGHRRAVYRAQIQQQSGTLIFGKLSNFRPNQA